MPTEECSCLPSQIVKRIISIHCIHKSHTMTFNLNDDSNDFVSFYYTGFTCKQVKVFPIFYFKSILLLQKMSYNNNLQISIPYFIIELVLKSYGGVSDLASPSIVISYIMFIFVSFLPRLLSQMLINHPYHFFFP